MKDTLVIAFSGGSYGSYLEWVLATMQDSGSIVAPFDRSTGNSHHSRLGMHLVNMAGFEQYICMPETLATVRIHPKTQQHEHVTSNMEHILAHCSKSILLYPDDDSKLLCINNQFQKVDNDWWAWKFRTGSLDIKQLHNGWPETKHMTADEIPLWIRREFLSFYLFTAWQSEVDWGMVQNWQHPRCLIVTVSALLFDFKNTVNSITSFWGANLNKSIDDMLPYHDIMLGLQQHIGQDRVCKQVVQSVLSGQHYTWSPLPLPSQAWVQAELRNQGWEIKCAGLDEFPTDSQALEKLIYPATK